MKLLLIAGTLWLVACGGDKQPDPFAASKVELAQIAVRKLVNESYALWVSRPSNTGKCPDVSALRELNNIDANDPWGEPWQLRCDNLPPGALGIAVWSRGPDRKDGTADDVQSWE